MTRPFQLLSDRNDVSRFADEDETSPGVWVWLARAYAYSQMNEWTYEKTSMELRELNDCRARGHYGQYTAFCSATLSGETIIRVVKTGEFPVPCVIYSTRPTPGEYPIADFGYDFPDLRNVLAWAYRNKKGVQYV